VDLFNSENEVLNQGLFKYKNPTKQASYERDQGRRRILKGQAAREFANERQKDLIDDFRTRRARSRREASFSGGGDVFAALPRFYNPREYFEMSQIPYDIKDDKQRVELYKWLDMFYKTHYLVPTLVDIFTRFPLVGLELKSKDKHLKAFYEDIFLDRLDYQEFLVKLGRYYWVMGEAFPLGHFNTTLGIWEEEELLDPSAVHVKRFPIIGGEQFYVEPDEALINLVKKREPKGAFYLLQRDFSDLIPFIQRQEPFPVDGVLLKQIANKVNPQDLHGTPILLRALRTLMHEEKLMASQDAIAERLYSPLILVKLGIQDMGANQPPWLPSLGDVQSVRDDFDLALSSDFRLLVHHFGIEVQNVFGRDQMPKLGDDFDRIERRLMQVFGVNPSLLSAGSNSQPYASSALQAELMNQLMATFQRMLIKHYESRASIVAEAQEHFDYEQRGETRIPIMEEVLEIDPDTGEEILVEKPKLLYPEMRFQALDLRDEATQRQYMQAIRQMGVPIPDADLAFGMRYKFNEALEAVEDETIQKTVAQQDAKLTSYKVLKAKGLPIPPDLKAEIEGSGIMGPAPGEEIPTGIQPPPEPGENIVMPPPPEDMGGAGPATPEDGSGPGSAPQVSQEAMGPQVPGVPGQPGIMGVPGAPTPAIGPTSHVASYDEVEEDKDEHRLIKRLPKNAANLQIKKLTAVEKFATIDENEEPEIEESP
jgi:hypothetical protein